MPTTSTVDVTAGSGTHVATYDITEDSETKKLQRVSLADPSGTGATVRAASTGSAASTDTAVVVTVRDNNGNGQTTMANSAPTTFASDQTIPNKAVTQSAGLTNSRVNSAASTNATSLKASAGNAFRVDVFNVATYDVFVKFYDKASAPTVGTDTPVWTVPIKAGTGYSRDFPLGFNFATGIAYAITKLQADSDTTAVVAGDVTGTIGWI